MGRLITCRVIGQRDKRQHEAEACGAAWHGAAQRRPVQCSAVACDVVLRFSATEKKTPWIVNAGQKKSGAALKRTDKAQPKHGPSPSVVPKSAKRECTTQNRAHSTPG